MAFMQGLSLVPSSRVSAFDNRSGLAGSKGLAPIGRANRLTAANGPSLNPNL